MSLKPWSSIEGYAGAEKVVIAKSSVAHPYKDTWKSATVECFGVYKLNDMIYYVLQESASSSMSDETGFRAYAATKAMMVVLSKSNPGIKEFVLRFSPLLLQQQPVAAVAKCAADSTKTAGTTPAPAVVTHQKLPVQPQVVYHGSVTRLAFEDVISDKWEREGLDEMRKVVACQSVPLKMESLPENVCQLLARQYAEQSRVSSGTIYVGFVDTK